MNQTSDIYELKLEENTLALQECQKNKNIDSCLKCEQTLECETRENYVKAVYESMNKGQGGDFEF